VIARDVVKAAALLAARHAWPDLHASLVRWSDEAQSQAGGDSPQVTLSTISHVPEGPMSVRRSYDAGSDELTQRMLQPFIWTVQLKCEGWKLDSAQGNNPVLFAHRMRFGWYLQTVIAALLDPDSEEDERCPVKMVDEVGQVLTLNQRVRGHTLPVLAFEIEFRYVARDTDPTPVPILETAVIGGSLAGVDAEITTES
jgi:hypothetical protein